MFLRMGGYRKANMPEYSYIDSGRMQLTIQPTVVV